MFIVPEALNKLQDHDPKLPDGGMGKGCDSER